jgi:COMPASS component SWD3
MEIEQVAPPSMESASNQASSEIEEGLSRERASRSSIPPQPPTESVRPPGPKYRLKYTLSGHSMSISSLKFSPDGSLLASSASDKLVKLWDSYTGDIIRTLSGHTEGISDVAWSNDSDYLATASDDKSVRIWSVKDVGTLTSLGYLFLKDL